MPATVQAALDAEIDDASPRGRRIGLIAVLAIVVLNGLVAAALLVTVH